jgi:hypothetical protein
VLGAHRRSVECEEPTTLEDAVDDGLGKILVMEHAAPGAESLVRGEDHGALAAVSIVDDVEEHVCGVGAIGETSTTT